MFASRKRVTDVAKTAMPIIQQLQQQQQQPTASNQQKLELAKRLASQIQVSKSMQEAAAITQQTAAAILKGGSLANSQVSVSMRISGIVCKLCN